MKDKLTIKNGGVQRLGINATRFVLESLCKKIQDMVKDMEYNEHIIFSVHYTDACLGIIDNPEKRRPSEIYDIKITELGFVPKEQGDIKLITLEVE